MYIIPIYVKLDRRSCKSPFSACSNKVSYTIYAQFYSRTEITYSCTVDDNEHVLSHGKCLEQIIRASIVSDAGGSANSMKVGGE